MTIGHILAAKGRDVVTTQRHQTLAEVAEVLLAKNIGAVVVTNVQGRVIGIFPNAILFVAVAKRGPPCSTTLCQAHDRRGDDDE